MAAAGSTHEQAATPFTWGTTAAVHALDEPGGRIALKVPYPHGPHRAVQARSQALIERVGEPRLPRLVGRRRHGDDEAWAYRWGGVDLQAWLDRGGVGAAGFAIAIAAEVAGVLASMHAAGVGHRAIRPEHVLVAPDGAVTVTGLGVALAADWPRPPDEPDDDPERDPDAWVARALRYAAPEQFRPGTAGLASDVWATAILTCELVGAHPLPRDAETMEHAAAILRGLEVPALVPAALRAALAPALAAAPSQRPTAAELRDTLAGAAASLRTTTSPTIIAAGLR
jgi:hypothetical protein